MQRVDKKYRNVENQMAHRPVGNEKKKKKEIGREENPDMQNKTH